MNLDPDIADWVLEFFLRQPMEEQTVNSLIRVLSRQNDNPKLKKSILLKKLECEVSRNLISERTLDLLEQLEEIEFQKGNEIVSDSMKRAYCAVAVECTVKPLETGDDGGIGSKYKFFEAVKRVWKGRIRRMEKRGGKCGLGSEMLWKWKDEIEAAVWDDCICNSVVEKKIKELNAVEMVNVYLKEEREKMGPPFLELLAMRVKNDEVMQRILRGEDVDQLARKEASLCTNGGHKGKIKLRDKVGLRRSRVLAVGTSRGAKVVDPDETTTRPLYENGDLPSSVEINKVRKALEKSSLELKAVVKDPLPDALRLAEAISVEERRKKRQRPVEDDSAKTNLFVVDDDGVVQAVGAGTSNDAPRPSLMERKSSARTYEWDESINRSQENFGSRDVLKLPSPGTIKNSPLNIDEVENLKRRRKGRRWSLLEEDTLRDGVQKFGKGNWKLILNAHRDIFEGRTEVDLKDKWRNLTRY